MGFRDEFFLTGKTYAEWSLERTVTGGFHDNAARLEAMQRSLVGRLDAGQARIEAGNAELRSEIRLQAKAMSEAVGDAVRTAGDEVASAVQNLADYLGGGLADLRWAVEQNTLVTREILDSILNSLEISSRKYFQQGAECFAVGDFELARERMECALQADRTNYFAYQYLGLIAAKEDAPDAALRHFSRALSFARTGHHKGIALSHLARTFLARGDVDEAVRHSQLAAAECTDSARLRYEVALCLARGMQVEACVHALRQAISMDWNFWGIAVTDESLDPAREFVMRLIDTMREEQLDRARAALQSVAAALPLASEAGADTSTLAAAHDQLHTRLSEGNVHIYREVIQAADALREAIYTAAVRSVRNRIQECETNLQKLEREKNATIAKVRDQIQDLRHRLTHLTQTYHGWTPGMSGMIMMGVGFVGPGLILMTIAEETNILPNSEVAFTIYSIVFLSSFWWGPVLVTLVAGHIHKQKYKTKPCHALKQQLDEAERAAGPLVAAAEHRYRTAAAAQKQEVVQLETLLGRVLASAEGEKRLP
jgi:tetratricopeptide (TPR) repeat protein